MHVPRTHGDASSSGDSVDSISRSVRTKRCLRCTQLPRHLDELTTRVNRAAVSYGGSWAKNASTPGRCLRAASDEERDVDQVDVPWTSRHGLVKHHDQMSIVETTTEFRTLIGQELDVEQMLRTSLEYIMEKVGPTNGVVFLREAEGDYGVGAYVNYEWQDRNILPTLELLGSAVCPQMQEDPGLLKFDDASDFAQCEGVDAELFNDAEVVAALSTIDDFWPCWLFRRTPRRSMIRWHRSSTHHGAGRAAGSHSPCSQAIDARGRTRRRTTPRSIWLPAGLQSCERRQRSSSADSVDVCGFEPHHDRAAATR